MIWSLKAVNFLRWICARLVLPAALVANVIGGQDARPDFTKLAPVSPCPELVEAARSRQIPFEKFDAPGEPGRLEPGDSFTGLATLFEKGGHETQWLFYLTALPASPKELARKDPKPLVLYSGRSNRFEYASAPVLVQLRTLGPVVVAGNSGHKSHFPDETVSFSLNKGFLGLGLDLAAATICRTEESHLHGMFWFGPEPPDSATVAKAKKGAEAALTADEERALGGALPAMFSYADIVEHTQGLDDILEQVVDKPSIWSVIGHLGVTVNLSIDSKHFGRQELESWGWSGKPTAYRFPMHMDINNKRALTVTLIVTSPRPPLLSCGGVVGMLAEKPSENGTYLMWRVISARYGHETAN